jgi:hypothetical protein
LISESFYIKENIKQNDIQYISELTIKSIQKTKEEEEVKKLCKILFENKPLYKNFEKISDIIEYNLNWEELKNLKKSN